jgi:hypothetical protein
MKYDFWFDLPKALVCIIAETATREENELTQYISTSNEVHIKLIFYRNLTES